MNSETASERDYVDARSAFLRRDFSTAFNLYRRLASAGREDCFAMLGWLYFDGKGTEQDLAAARLWLVRSAELGDAEGQFYLAKLCWYQRDVDGLVRWLGAASKRGYPPAYFRLGRLYEDGQFVERDFQSALRYYSEAADRGHLVGENRRALLLMLGKAGVSRMPYGLWAYSRSLVRMLREARRNSQSDAIRV